jgi:hypothetical protein
MFYDPKSFRQAMACYALGIYAFEAGFVSMALGFCLPFLILPGLLNKLGTY